MENKFYCVDNIHENLYHDSYFYAVYFNPVTLEYRRPMIGTTALAGGAYEDRSIDDTPKEVIELWDKKLGEHKAIERSRVPHIGAKVTIARARKYKGEGVVKSIAPNSYNYNRTEVAKVVFDDGRSTWADLDRLILVDAIHDDVIRLVA